MWGTDLLQGNEGRVLGELGQGYDAAQGFLGQAGGLYGGMAAQGQQGLDQYKNLTLGSGEDIQRQLEGTGGYQFNLGQGLQALQRTRAAQGMLNSGNTDTDAMTFASGLAGNTLNSERQALLPYLSMYQQGTAGQGGTLGAQAGLATDYYGNRGSVMDNTTKSIVGLGTEALKAGDQAKSQNQANMMNAGMGLAKLGLSAATGGMGGGFMNLGGAAAGGATGGMPGMGFWSNFAGT
ncbi:MAG: hypothetical protein Q7T60_17220 [Sphingopyxis sp.]|nr:hypothetical protein [Sphingopyxis sp.]